MTTQLDYFLAILSPSWPSLGRPSIIKVIAKIYTKSTSNLCKWLFTGILTVNSSWSSCIYSWKSLLYAIFLLILFINSYTHYNCYKCIRPIYSTPMDHHNHIVPPIHSLSNYLSKQELAIHQIILNDIPRVDYHKDSIIVPSFLLNILALSSSLQSNSQS